MAMLSSCAFLPDFSAIGGGGQGGSRDGSITIQPLFTRGDSGGVGSETITRAAAEEGDFRLDFSEDEVGGLGEASRAASWNAAIISTLLTGQQLSGRFGFEITGAIDGPSAGALKTIALIALQNGDEILETATMTGTINATGTIGPVGGIPEKIEGAAEAGIEKVLVPLGQRNTPNLAGEQVDVVRHGDRLGVEVVEVGDIYEAYEHLTGEAMEAPSGGGDPRVSGRSYDKVEAQVTAALGRYEAARSQYSGLSGDIVAVLDESGVPAQAADAAAKAQDLNRQGLVAGAFTQAQQAAALMETLGAAGSLLTPLQTQGLPGLTTLIDQATNSAPAESAFTSFVDSLGTFEPTTVTDVEALVNAYAGAFDAYTLLDFSVQRVASIGTSFENGTYTSLDQFFGDLVLSLMYLELAKSQIENAQSVFEVGRDNPSADIAEDIDLAKVGDFFRRGADANYAAFTTSGTVQSLADGNGLSNEVVISYLADFDLDVALATHQQAVLPAFEDYIGVDKPNAAYAAMGYGLSNYVRNQMLVEKYYNNAILDENYQIVGLSFEGSLNNAIDLSRDQLAAEIAVLAEHDSEPVITTATYEAAGVTAGGGEALERFATLSGYSAGFVTARLLTYLGGWEAGRAAD
jgi:uncharacterized protein